MIRSKDTQVILALAMGIVLIMAIIGAVLLFVPLRPLDPQDDATVTAHGEAHDLDLMMDAEISDVGIVFQVRQDRESYITFATEGRTAWTADEPNIEFEVLYELVGPKLTVEVTVQQETGTAINYDDTSLIIHVDPSLSTGLDVNLDVGNLFLKTMFGVELRDATLYCDVGSAEVVLASGTLLAGDIGLECKVGLGRTNYGRLGAGPGRRPGGGDGRGQRLYGHRTGRRPGTQPHGQLPF